jgi:hypothetical protein
METIARQQSSVGRPFEIIEYTKSQLKELLTDADFWMQPRLPITKRRALSQVSNPRADDDDTVLITAYSKDQLIACLGILPDWLISEGQKPIKFGWVTAWWVDKESGHRLAAMKILFSAMKIYSNRLAASFPSEDAVRVYETTKQFQECLRLGREYFIIGLPASFGSLAASVRWIAGAKNRLISNRKLQNRGLEIRTVEALDESLESLLNTWAIGDPLGRDSSYWNWVMKFPWMSASAEDEAVQEKYVCSVFAKDFRQIFMRVSRHGTPIGFLVMTLRNGRLCLKYVYYNAGDVADVADSVQAAIADINPWLFISADTGINAMLNKGIPIHFTKLKKSCSIYTAKALPLSVGCHQYLGTGDSIFH